MKTRILQVLWVTLNTLAFLILGIVLIGGNVAFGILVGILLFLLFCYILLFGGIIYAYVRYGEIGSIDTRIFEIIFCLPIYLNKRKLRK